MRRPYTFALSAVIIAMAAAVALAGTGKVAEVGTLFRIGTGGTGGTYYPVGRMLARMLMARPDGQDCGASCGASGLVAVAQISNGSVSNVESIRKGELEAGLAQSDVVQWAYSGTGTFAGRKPNRTLRAVANLYPETMHLVVLKGSGIRTVRDLRGKHVSLDEPGSGTLIDARLVLAAYGLKEKWLKAEYIKPSLSVAKMEQGKLDAFFFVGGYPVRSIAKLAQRRAIAIIPIVGAPARALLARNQFFFKDSIPAGTYHGVGRVQTVSVGAQLVVSAMLSDALAYRLTRTLWDRKTLKALRVSIVKGSQIKPKRALAGLSIPLHPGAVRYYREKGLLE